MSQDVTKPPIDGFVMAPLPSLEDEAAAVICGHPFVMAMSEQMAAEFHGFVQEVLQTVMKGGRPSWNGDRYTPCPTCGFRIVKVDRTPVVYRDDDD